MIVIGLMSGTSADGIDAAVVELLGAPPRLEWHVLGYSHFAHAPELREEIFACFRPETGSVDRLCSLNFALGEAFASAAIEAAQQAGLSMQQVDLIGSHGQTLWHIPTGKQASTLQLGEPAVIAERTGRPVVSNFRTRDMAAGGQGAPLVAYVDRILLTHPENRRAVQNIGGIANVTYLPKPGDGQSAFAFDTGPGNMLIDALAARVSGGRLACDVDGKLAASGKVHAGLLAELMETAYLHQAPPKTTGRELFGHTFADIVWTRAEALGLSAEDRLATVTAFTAESIARAYADFLPAQPDEVILSGGGALNPTLVSMLARRVAPARVLTSDELGLQAEAKEAVAFAVLAYESWHNRPGNLPEATGARQSVILGNFTPAPPRQSTIKPGSYTEARNSYTEKIDQVSTLEMVQMINREDIKVAEAVRPELPAIALAIDGIAARMQSGGRLIYIGAGTSGRLGILDASECPPTFSTPPELVIARIAGGKRAITNAVEGAEDDLEAGRREIEALEVNEKDSVVGIAASGHTPYVLGGMQEARHRGALVISLACNHPAPIEEHAEIVIAPLVGPEVVTGSTRLKAGTAQKLVLNMLSTGTMIRLGKTYSNLMVDVQMTNLKLRARGARIVAQACGISDAEARRLLEKCDNEVKTAIVSYLADIPAARARSRLTAVHGVIRKALSVKDL
ncbi:N-acetylmuramic acid 6-phosphate etherase [Longilinea arvoryzae]|uniref:Multifunctional fusion protein n=1 Tax=Longilinea arvoryzae TaxID=360412 RepID=A0A0S7BIQ6_9CHLR|nr:anhydro-N-acetylmuramic acid kinase [Longilinea arvoryzae]GAP13745.1 N-acetylmuramic acid 6-phosphate etherase [Longilinea arvoryzae]